MLRFAPGRPVGHNGRVKQHPTGPHLPADQSPDVDQSPAADPWYHANILLAATPIGQVDDASPRLLHALASADVVAAEDTRRVRDFARRAGIDIPGKIIAFHDHNEADKTPHLLHAARDQRIVIVSDAGMPAISDPGFRLVRAAYAAGIAVSALPGPSAVLTALTLSGLASDRFCFEGFLPRAGSRRRKRIAELAREERTMVLFESPRRLAATLEELAGSLGPQRPAAVCRELTKTYQEVKRAPLAELARWAEDVRGEITVVIAGAAPTAARAEDHVEEVLRLRDAGMRLKDAAGEVAQATGISKRELYQAALEH